MAKLRGFILLLLAWTGNCLSQDRDVTFEAGFFINGDSSDVHVLEGYVSSDGQSGSLKEVTLNSWFFVIEEWSTEDGNLEVKKTGHNTFQLHATTKIGMNYAEKFFTFEMGLWDNLYSLFEINGTSVNVIQFGPNKGKIFNNNYIPIRLSENRSDVIRTMRISLPGIYMGVKRIK